MEKGGEEMERQEGMQNTTAGGPVIPQNPPPAPAAQMQTKTEPLKLRLRVFRPQPPPPRVCSNAHTHHHHHLVYTTPGPLPTSLHCCFQRRAQNRALVGRFQDFGPKPATPACAVQRATPPPTSPHRHHPTTSPHLPPSLFPTARPNRALAGQFRDFGPKPATSACAAQHVTPPPTSPRRHHPTTSPHLPPLLFPMARPELSSNGPVSGFWPKPLPEPRVSNRTATPLPPPPPHHSTTPPHRPPLPFHMARPKPSYNSSVSRFWPKPPPRALCFQPNGHTTTTTTTTPSHHPSTSSPAAVSHGVPKTEP
ncbi:hypothetical protein PILCRDRAFT_15220 [Piloderma croceum F 1598]|uniref:Uncharacterized protein n=1 Tax=Piloderma croceum (strain F 1598) TaxID=765440 RepID=A0A0C3ELF2_PILCF|nr:hypothetical protein PILCRDRAFT_15220 [Piloderma croceum F 1598]